MRKLRIVYGVQAKLLNAKEIERRPLTLGIAQSPLNERSIE